MKMICRFCGDKLMYLLKGALLVLLTISWPQACIGGDFESVSSLNDSQRIEWVIDNYRKYSEQIRKSVIRVRVQERGSINDLSFTSDNTKKPSNFSNNELTHEIVTTQGKTFVSIQMPRNEKTVTACRNAESKIYLYNAGGGLVQVERVCEPPPVSSTSFRFFVASTGIADFDDPSVEKQAEFIRRFTWKGVLRDDKNREFVMLNFLQSASRGDVDWNLSFGFRDSFLVLLSEEVVSRGHIERDTSQNSTVRQEITYRSQSIGPFPNAWTRFVNTEVFDAKKTLLGSNLIQSTTSTVSEFKVLDKFPDEILDIPIDPKAAIIDRCQQSAQTAVAQNVKAQAKSSNRWWLLLLGVAALATTAYFYRKSRQIGL